jgi:hypothetical protein
MKSFIGYLGLMALSLHWAGPCHGDEALTKTTEVLARLHFAGVEQLKDSTNAATLKEVWSLPATIGLRDQSLEKLARALAKSFVAAADDAETDPARLIRPLLDDVLRSESYIEVRGGTNQSLAWTLALRLDKDRVGLWQTNGSRLLTGWNSKKDRGTNQLSFATLNSWLVAAYSPGAGGSSNPAMADSMFEQIRTNGRPAAAIVDHWIKADMDLSKLAIALRLPPSENWPRVEISLSGKANNLRSNARLVFPSAINWQIENWQIPTNTIRDPHNSLISFTAVQGFSPWLNRQPLWRELELQPLPNQFFAWGQTHLPFQIQVAFQVTDATNWLDRISTRWLHHWNTNLAHHAVGKVYFLTNRAELLWRGLPVLFPYLQPAPEPGRHFLWGGIFPVDQATNPPPAELLRQLTSRTNLLYYDWEITQGRLAQLRPLVELLSQVTTVPIIATNSASAQWLESIESRLGNSITEISAPSPRELNVVRNSHIGLNGLELVTLAYWLDSLEFPKLDYRIAFRPVKRSAK